MIFGYLIKFVTFAPVFASINTKAAKKNWFNHETKEKRRLAGDLTGDLVVDIVAKNLSYCSKTVLAGAKKMLL
jgi:hypothetical protein